jgi:hypothetical protein
MRLFYIGDVPRKDALSVLAPIFDQVGVLLEGPHCDCEGEVYVPGQGLGEIYTPAGRKYLNVSGTGTGPDGEQSSLIASGQVYVPGQGLGQIATDCECNP